MKPGRRHIVLFIALAATLSASAWTHWREQADVAIAPVSAAVERTTVATDSATETPESVPPKLALARLERPEHQDEETPGGSGIDPFRAKNWYVPPPPPPPAPPPKPTAPALPFQYMGKREDAGGDGKIKVYLTRGDEVYTVSPGDTFATNYRFEKIDKGALVFEYLPLSTQQRLPLGISE
ncbi:MAG: hypothetical protein EKK46_02635 [Rhodocyclaceae bacterium]|nr:MAG: hypothetical protein EKK46_02635 [Rhodocyclaceae bacterium]